MILQDGSCLSPNGKSFIRANFEELRLAEDDVMSMFSTSKTREKIEKMIRRTNEMLRFEVFNNNLFYYCCAFAGLTFY